MRPEGYYWVKAHGEWTVAYWRADLELWMFRGFANTYTAVSQALITEVGPAVVKPEGLR